MDEKADDKMGFWKLMTTHLTRRTPLLEVGGAQRGVNWEGETIERNALSSGIEGTMYQMLEMCGGNSATWMMDWMAIANPTGCAHLMLKSGSWLEEPEILTHGMEISRWMSLKILTPRIPLNLLSLQK